MRISSTPLSIHADDPGYGYRFITDELAEHGIVASKNRVWRLCSNMRIFSLHSKKRGLNRKPGPPAHDDLLKVTDKHGRPTRDFTADAPNATWLTHITEHPTGEGKLYLCAVKDCYFKQDRGLLHRLEDEVLAGGLGGPQRHRPALTCCRHDSA